VRRDYRRSGRRPKEAGPALAAVLLAAAVQLPGCFSARACLDEVPEELRADVVRLAIDESFVRPDQIPRRDFLLAIQYGDPFKDLEPTRAAKVRRYTLRYQACILDRTRY
jgi:hypothetical protein